MLNHKKRYMEKLKQVTYKNCSFMLSRFNIKNKNTNNNNMSCLCLFIQHKSSNNSIKNERKISFDDKSII